MLPLPTRAAAAAFIAACLAGALGLATGTLLPTVLAAVSFAAMAFALGLTIPLGRRVRRMQLEFAWWPNATTSAGAVVPRTPFEVKCFIRHRAPFDIALSDLTPLVPGGPRVIDEEARALVLPEGARTEFSFHMVAPSVGRVVLHGLAVKVRGPLGLFEVPLYFPNPLVIKVLPRVAAVGRGASLATSGLPIDRQGRAAHLRRGGGTELHELRDLVPGDSFRSIAWKASARTGRLMVREVEQEVQQTRWSIVDVSGSMRGGEPGHRKLDAALEMTAVDARRAIEASDRVGVITLDGRIVRHVSPRDDRAQLIRIYDMLLAATEIVDSDLTEIDDDALVETVGQYLRRQDGIDFARRDGEARWDTGRIVRHIRRTLPRSDAEALPIAATTALGDLRRFCRERGIPLPYRPDPRDGSKAQGIALALRHVLAADRAPAVITVFTDFDGIADFGVLTTAVKLLSSHGHRVVFEVPRLDLQHVAAGGGIAQDLASIFARAEEVRIRHAKEVLVRVGGIVHSSKQRSPSAVGSPSAQPWNVGAASAGEAA